MWQIYNDSANIFVNIVHVPTHADVYYYLTKVESRDQPFLWIKHDAKEKKKYKFKISKECTLCVNKIHCIYTGYVGIYSNQRLTKKKC